MWYILTFIGGVVVAIALVPLYLILCAFGVFRSPINW